MKNVLIALFILSIGCMANAQDQTPLQVDEMVFSADVVNRAPVGVDSVFVNTIEKIYCFTKVSGGSGSTSITHKWYHQNKEIAVIALPVQSTVWRTWSSKRIIEEWTGMWRVDVVSAEGNILASQSFELK